MVKIVFCSKTNGHGVCGFSDDVVDESCSSIVVQDMNQDAVRSRGSELGPLMKMVEERTGKDLSVLKLVKRMDPWGPFWMIKSGRVIADMCGAPVLKELTQGAIRVFVWDYIFYLLDLLYSTGTCNSLLYFPLSLCVHPSLRMEMAKVEFGKNWNEVAEVEWVQYCLQLPELKDQEIEVLNWLETLISGAECVQYGSEKIKTERVAEDYVGDFVECSSDEEVDEDLVFKDPVIEDCCDSRDPDWFVEDTVGSSDFLVDANQESSRGTKNLLFGYLESLLEGKVFLKKSVIWKRISCLKISF